QLLRGHPGRRARPRPGGDRPPGPRALRLDRLGRDRPPRVAVVARRAAAARPLRLGGADEGQPAPPAGPAEGPPRRRRAPECRRRRRSEARPDPRSMEAASSERLRRPSPAGRVPGEPAVSGPPEFVVVGRVNKGKSSIVATLAEEESVP